MKRSHAKARLSLAALPLLWLAACQSAPTRTYTLYAVPSSAATASYSGPPLRVDEVHMPASIDRAEIMLDVSHGELKISDLDHWSAPLGQMARQTLSQDLILRMPPGKIIFPRLPKPAGALGVSVDILNFQADREAAQLTASWLISPRTADAAAGGTASVSLAGTSSGALAMVQALSALLGQLADRIVGGL